MRLLVWLSAGKAKGETSHIFLSVVLSDGRLMVCDLSLVGCDNVRTAIRTNCVWAPSVFSCHRHQKSKQTNEKVNLIGLDTVLVHSDCLWISNNHGTINDAISLVIRRQSCSYCVTCRNEQADGPSLSTVVLFVFFEYDFDPHIT